MRKLKEVYFFMRKYYQYAHQDTYVFTCMTTCDILMQINIQTMLMEFTLPKTVKHFTYWNILWNMEYIIKGSCEPTREYEMPTPNAIWR